MSLVTLVGRNNKHNTALILHAFVVGSGERDPTVHYMVVDPTANVGRIYRVANIGMMPLALLGLATSCGSSPSALARSRVHKALQLRGGEVAAALPPLDALATEPLQLQVAEGDESLPTSRAQQVPVVGLSSSAIESLKLRPGSRVQLSKVERPVWWAPSPTEMVGEVAQVDEAGNSVQVPKAVMKAVDLRAGAAVLVMAQPEAEADAAAPYAGTRVDRYGRRSGWMRALWWSYMIAPSRHARDGHGYGYGYGHSGKSYYGRRGYGTRVYTARKQHSSRRSRRRRAFMRGSRF